MKRSRILAILFLVILLFSGCDRLTAKPYYTTNYDRRYKIDPQKRTISAGGVDYKYRISGNWEEYSIQIKYPDGNVYTEYGSNGKRETYNYLRSLSLMPWWAADGGDLAEALYNEIPESGGNTYWIFPAVLIFLGCANILCPKMFWFFRYGLSVRYMELSNKALNFHTFGGLAAIAVGILLFFV